MMLRFKPSGAVVMFGFIVASSLAAVALGLRREWSSMAFQGGLTLAATGLLVRIRHLDKHYKPYVFPLPDVVDKMADVFQGLQSDVQVARCPADVPGLRCPTPFFNIPLRPGHLYTAPLYAFVMHLNDRHHWSREVLADWIETLDIDITATSLDNPERREIM